MYVPLPAYPLPESALTETAAERFAARGERDGWALCLSGGGYRAALFHLGALRRLNECGVLGRFDMVSSVSGGSILAAHLARVLAPWPIPGAVVPGWEDRVAAPFRAFCSRDIRTPALFRSLRNPWRLLTSGLDAAALENAYFRFLTSDLLRDLPERPRFVFCATELLTATLWRFERENTGSWRTPRLKPDGGDTVAHAVTASSCFPPLFASIPPLADASRIREVDVGAGREPLPGSQLRLSDGGVYDNLGIEPAIKRHAVLLLSDGGAPFDFIRARGLLGQGKRVFDVVSKQVANLRWQEFFRLRTAGDIAGGYWALTDAQADADGTEGRYSAAFAREVISTIRTDLNHFTPTEAGVLENHGYWQCDATLRKQPESLGINLPPTRSPHPELANEIHLREALRERARRLPRNPLRALLALWRARRLP